VYHVCVDSDVTPSLCVVFATDGSRAPSAREPLEGFVERPRTTMARAKEWTLEVENAFRVQEVGYRDIDEYVSLRGVPEVWPQTGLYR
jgi:hypothetical protein